MKANISKSLSMRALPPAGKRPSSKDNAENFRSEPGSSMRYELAGQKAVFLLEHPKCHHPSKRFVSFEGVAIDEPSLHRLLEVVCHQGRRHSRGRQEQLIGTFVKPWAAFFRQQRLQYPSSAIDWQAALIHFMQFYLLDRTYSKSLVRTRILSWQSAVVSSFVFWIEEKIIPRQVEIPTARLKSEGTGLSDIALLGRPNRKTARLAAPLQKLLVDVSFARNDADYLFLVERDCRAKISALRAVCLKHWTSMRADHLAGKTLAAQVAPTQIDARIRDNAYRRPVVTSDHWLAVTNPAFADGHMWALALAQRWLSAGPGLDCIAQDTLRSSPFFRSKDFSPNSRGALSYPALASLTTIPSRAFYSKSKAAEFYRFVGVLSEIDAAVACCLLIMEHPEFNPASLLDAQLLDDSGRLYLEATDKEGRVRFSVDKPRAGVRKEAILTTFAHEIVAHVAEVSAPIRALMRDSGHKAWRSLFLGLQGGGHVGAFKRNLVVRLTKDPLNLTRLYPELKEHGLGNGELDFRRVRNTMGVLRWFESGSIVEMSRRLGNSQQVALEHYLPPSLLQAWNTRIIRRFQNTLILLAAHQEDHLLDVSDFSTLGDLLHFMAQLLSDHPRGSSPIATEISRRLRALVQPEEAEVTEPEQGCDERLLNIRCSAASLAYLYAFDYYVTYEHSSWRGFVEPISGLSVQPFIDLSRMLRHACESTEVSAALSEQLDMASLRRAHESALTQQTQLRERFSSFTFSHSWDVPCAA